jgi:hypothetical protein
MGLIEKNRVATQREKFKLEVEMGEYVRRLDAVRDVETGNAVVRREIGKALEFELPPRLELLKAPQIRSILLAKFNHIFDHLPELITRSAHHGNGR